ncbi:MAG: TIGR02597 family protein [Verrucomicrobiaceae bacterium]|nr:TIGR02597 family protein [Verrucomicrobiaceae bacterium]
MKTNIGTLLLTAVVALPAMIQAQPVYTPPVGFVSVTIPANSDAAIGAPLSRADEFVGVVESISSNVITLAGTPNFTVNQFVYASGTQPKTYFLRVDSDTKEGMILKVESNTANSVTVTIPAGESLAGILTNAVDNTGSAVSISPYWTPSTLVTGVLAGTQILRYPTNVAGTNLATSSTYTFNGTNWLQGVTNVNDLTFNPGEGFTLRNNSTTTQQTISITGAVPMTGVRSRFYTLAANTTQDQRIFYNSPVPEVIGNVFPPAALVAGDRLLAFNNAATGKNKSASTTLIWNGTNWLQGVTVVTTTYQLQPGTSYVFRKNQTGANPTSVVWSDLQSYLQ